MELTQEEIWKPVVGYEKYYMVSNKGRIKSLDREINNNGGMCVRKGRMMSFGKTYDGYLMCGLTSNGKRRGFGVHRIVAKAFIENNDNLPIINHIDEIKDNNCVSNLEWCTYSHNNLHNGKASKVGKLVRKPIIQMTLDLKPLKRWCSATGASKELGLSRASICDNLNGKNKTAGGYKWKFV